MTDIETRVSNCFANVFPDLAPADVKQASQESLATWDSVAHITLLAAIAEEFHFELDEEFLENLTSYPRIIDYIRSHTSGA